MNPELDRLRDECGSRPRKAGAGPRRPRSAPRLRQRARRARHGRRGAATAPRPRQRSDFHVGASPSTPSTLHRHLFDAALDAHLAAKLPPVQRERSARVRAELVALARRAIREEREAMVVEPAQEDDACGRTSVRRRGRERHRERLSGRRRWHRRAIGGAGRADRRRDRDRSPRDRMLHRQVGRIGWRAWQRPA